jgi:predicted nucleic acid-binding protein
MPEQIVYLDSSAIVKHYVRETGSEAIDSIFKELETRSIKICFSMWNLGEVSGVLDKYSRKGAVDYDDTLKKFFNDIDRYVGFGSIEVINVTPLLLSRSIKTLRKYHIYISDALQIETCRSVNAVLLVTGDKGLRDAATNEGMKVNYVGPKK